MRQINRYIIIVVLVMLHAGVRAQSTVTDTSALKLVMQKVFAHFDSSYQPVFLTGTMRVIDGYDSSQNMPLTSFAMARAGKDFYYKAGARETYNSNTAYVYIDHVVKHALIGRPKLVVSPLIGNLDGIAHYLESEQYAVTMTSNGKESTVSFLNEMHVTCKEYTVVYDKENFAPKRIFVRLTNLADASNPKADKRIIFTFGEWRKEVPAQVFNYTGVLEKINGSWKGKGSLANYKLTVL
ncbi:MAG: hypothetical protein J0I41_00495 [Filimonas sp.]|nr:hypothetical protein [Filimonas sp.]